MNSLTEKLNLWFGTRITYLYQPNVICKKEDFTFKPVFKSIDAYPLDLAIVDNMRDVIYAWCHLQPGGIMAFTAAIIEINDDVYDIRYEFDDFLKCVKHVPMMRHDYTMVMKTL